MDPGVAALYGALIGAGSSVVVQSIAAFISARRETRSFRRTLRKEAIASVTDAYEHALNVFFNMKRGATPDRTTYGNVFAQLTLRGSPDVKMLMDEFQKLPFAEQPNFDVNRIVKAM